MCEEWIKNGKDWKQETLLYAIPVTHGKIMMVVMEEINEDSGGIVRRKNQ